MCKWKARANAWCKHTMTAQEYTNWGKPHSTTIILASMAMDCGYICQSSFAAARRRGLPCWHMGHTPKHNFAARLPALIPGLSYD